MLRITGGIRKGESLKCKRGSSTRPTQGKVRQAIFNILQDKVVEARILDLFSGSGILGIEALSRGSVKCTFVDADRSCCKIIQTNLSKLEFKGEILCMNVQRALKVLKKKGRYYHIVFADPPYEKRYARKLLSQLLQSGILTRSALIVLEHSKREIPEIPEGMILVTQKRYGDTMVDVYKAI